MIALAATKARSHHDKRRPAALLEGGDVAILRSIEDTAYPGSSEEYSDTSITNGEARAFTARRRVIAGV